MSFLSKFDYIFTFYFFRFQMFSLRSLLHSLPSCTARLTTPVTFQPSVLSLSTSAVWRDEKVGSTWRLPRYDGNANAVWPNYQKHYTHHKYEICLAMLII